MFVLDGKTAVITGGAAGIGAAIARRLARAGADVVVADIADGSGIAGELDGRYVCTDVGDAESVEALFASLEGSGADILVNNAGIARDLADLSDDEPEHYAQLINVNALGAVRCIAAAARSMSGGGTIVNVASTAACEAFPGLGAYSASKAALLSVTRTAAVELAGQAIRVNAVCPGSIDTDMARGEDGPDPIAASTIAAAPLARSGKPAEVAAAVHFLASDDCGWMTGATLVVDGGIQAAAFDRGTLGK